MNNTSPYIILVVIYAIGLACILISNFAAKVARLILQRKMRKHAENKSR